MKIKIKNIFGFTLVELIVVISVLAILGTIAFVSLQWYSRSARDSLRITDIQTIKTTFELFSLKSGHYPEPSHWDKKTFNGSLVYTQWTFWDTTFTNVTNINKIPLDPITFEEYPYSLTNDRQEYQVAFLLENDRYTFNNNFVNATEVNYQFNIKWNYNGISVWFYNESVWNYSLLSLHSLFTPFMDLTYLTPEDFLYNWSSVSRYILKNKVIPKQKQVISSGWEWTNTERQSLLIFEWDKEDLTDPSVLGNILTSIAAIYDDKPLWNYNEAIAKIVNLNNDENEKIEPDVQNELVWLANVLLKWKIKVNKINSLASKIKVIWDWICWEDQWGSFSYAEPPTKLCDWGIAGLIIDNWVGNIYSWMCKWWVWKQSISCSALHVGVIDWECWLAMWWDYLDEPTINLCTQWDSTEISLSNDLLSYEWNCNWQNGWFANECSANNIKSIDWVCWREHGLLLYNSPWQYLCREWLGEWLSLTGDIYNWTCKWVNAWLDTSCSASVSKNFWWHVYPAITNTGTWTFIVEEWVTSYKATLYWAWWAGWVSGDNCYAWRNGWNGESVEISEKNVVNGDIITFLIWEWWSASNIVSWYAEDWSNTSIIWISNVAWWWKWWGSWTLYNTKWVQNAANTWNGLWWIWWIWGHKINNKCWITWTDWWNWSIELYHRNVIPTRYPWCDKDDITIEADDKSRSYTLAACNLWTNISWTWEDSYWNKYLHADAIVSCAEWYTLPSIDDWLTISSAYRNPYRVMDYVNDLLLPLTGKDDYSYAWLKAYYHSLKLWNQWRVNIHYLHNNQRLDSFDSSPGGNSSYTISVRCMIDNK